MFSRRPKPSAVPQDQGEQALQAIGQELREARTARGEDLHDVAAFLRIRPAYLAALERGDVSLMPGRPYAIGFLRSYGGYLGLDGNALVARLKPAVAGVPTRPGWSHREPLSESRRPTVGAVTASLVLAGALYAGYHQLTAERDGPAEQVAEAPAPVTLAPPTGAVPRGVARPALSPTEDAVPPAPSESAEAPSGDQAGSPSPHPAADVTSAVAAESVPESTASAPVVLTALDSDEATAPVPSGGRSEGRVILVARDTSWIQVRSPDRSFVRTRTLQSGERFVVPERADLVLSTGNAGGLEILVDGQSVGVVGASGAVIRDLPLAPASLKARTAVPR